MICDDVLAKGVKIKEGLNVPLDASSSGVSTKSGNAKPQEAEGQVLQTADQILPGVRIARLGASHDQWTIHRSIFTASAIQFSA